ncbi:non-ribosomal peptide synthetase [Microtetraspora niveoalba]|uniref:non-ribosomal peptide synthetase n=1 Tax=Microtetraspora niveoalba TaxID=46175 RepID=UPI000832C699|nr:non-ribosomal peptide synthetase [Microtetraspora niveoalba]
MSAPASPVRAPLSPAQERLWLLQRLYPDDASYTMYLVRRLRGPLDRAALEEAFARVVARHESLRTRFAEVDGVPWAVAAPPEAGVPAPDIPARDIPVPDAAVSDFRVSDVRVSDVAVPRAGGPVDWLDAADREAAERLVAERVNAPFDLARGVPLRVAVIRIAADDHVLCVTMHHIIGDGWSLNVLLDDLAECYAARLGGREPRLRPLPVQPTDYARWQRRRAERAVPYWQERLADPPPPEPPFPTTGAGDAEETGAGRRGAFHSVRLGEETTRGLERLGREHRTTLFAVLMAAYQVLLHRHTGQTDLLVGTAVAGRDRVELEPLVGYLAQTVVLRGDLAGDPAFTDLLARTRTEALNAMSRPSVPFERIGHPPDALMPTMLILHNQDTGPARPFGDLAVSLFPDGFRQAKLDLLVEAWRDGPELVVSFCYDASRVEAGGAGRETVRRLADRFRLLLGSVAAEPHRRISELRLWTEADRADIRALAGDGADPAGPLVPELLAEAARRTPDAAAVICGDTVVSHWELHARAGALAAGLGAAGVRPGDVVGVCLPRSVDAITALLAVWRAGAAYLPLDPDDPDERLAFSLADCGVTHVVTRRDLPGGFTAIAPATDPEADPEAVAGAGPPIAPPAGPADLAYVITTSGSTGRPKGVAVEHAAIAARVRWMREEYGLTPGDHVVQFASLSFDTHLEEVFPALAAGAALVLLPEGAATLPDLLASPEGRRVSVLDLPTAYWHHLVEEVDQIAWPRSLRLVILGGEQASGAAVARWHDRFGTGVRLVNTYGPTEAAVIATATPLTRDDGGAAGRPPIGRPVGATAVHLLDGRGAPLPKGAVGELVIGGAGVARGYLGRPALTAAAFVPDPGGPPGARRYRTGDRARWRQDGRLEFLGRIDDQLKVRGFRIEPGEVEARLLAHPEVGQAFVTVRAERLVANVTGTAGHEDLRAHLARALPRHLVPADWVTLDALPLTARGKIDRAALPEPARASSPADVPPRTDAEKLVAGIWEELLDVPAVGAFDDFFTLGGHSLLATRIAARLRRTTGVEVPVRTVFEARTVAELASAVEELLIAELDGMTDEEAERLLASPGT